MKCQYFAVRHASQPEIIRLSFEKVETPIEAFKDAFGSAYGDIEYRALGTIKSRLQVHSWLQSELKKEWTKVCVCMHGKIVSSMQFCYVNHFKKNERKK